MYYIQYLSSLCRRRRWPDPLYEPKACGAGYACTVFVDRRKYQTDTTYETETLAKEAAAMRAYLICRNQALSDNMAASPNGDALLRGAGVVAAASAGWSGRGT
jgi:hypothetical protein